MQLEDYFDFEKLDTQFGPAERIRIKGHRIAIDDVIEYFNQGVAPDVIQRDHYPTLTLEEVNAAVSYYLQNKAEVDAYLERGRKIEDAFYKEHLKKEPDPVVKRLRALRAKQPEGERSPDG